VLSGSGSGPVGCWILASGEDRPHRRAPTTSSLRMNRSWWIWARSQALLDKPHVRHRLHARKAYRANRAASDPMHHRTSRTGTPRGAGQASAAAARLGFSKSNLGPPENRVSYRPRHRSRAGQTAIIARGGMPAEAGMNSPCV
jgi:hypothetical protein